METANNQKQKGKCVFSSKENRSTGRMHCFRANTHSYDLGGGACDCWLTVTLSRLIEDKRVSPALNVFSLTCGVPAM